MQVIETVAAMRGARAEVLGKLGFVPTMGALHAGHLSLMRQSVERCDATAVSIFVNPTQFGPNEDFDRYPRTVEADLAACESVGVDMVFLPSVLEMYPVDEIVTEIDVPGLANDLEGAKRAGHFVGVCRVVTKLFNMVQPNVAVFGQKDFQQLRIIEAMTDAMALPIEIVRGGTVREADGLAMSSRNRYLDAEQRERALGLSRALRAGREMILAGEADFEKVESAMRRMIAEAGLELDYVVVRDAVTLGEPIDLEHDFVLLGAVRLGAIRLIDNVLLGGG